MTIEEAIKRAEETAIGEDELCKRYDRASGYSRNHDETIRTTDAKRCEKIAQEHRQLAEWLKDYKRLLENSSEIPTSSDDCISRFEVTEIINSEYDIDKMLDRVDELPPAKPIRPKGHWIAVYQGDEIINYRCSECEFGNTFGKGTIGMNFCSHCGADMRGEE
jgi:hypothetical protein